MTAFQEILTPFVLFALTRSDQHIVSDKGICAHLGSYCQISAALIVLYGYTAPETPSPTTRRTYRASAVAKAVITACLLPVQISPCCIRYSQDSGACLVSCCHLL